MKRKKVFSLVFGGLLITGLSIITLTVLGEESRPSINSSSVPIDNKEKRIPVHAELNVEPLEKTIQTMSDLVAEVEIGNIIKEMDEPGPKTIYSAKVLDVLSGDETLKEISVLQQGNSRYEFNGNRMFKSGEKYILVLKNAPELGESVYWIRGEETQIYEVLEDNDLLRWSTPFENELIDIEKEKKVKVTNILKEKNYKIIDKKLFKEKIKKIKKND